LLASFETFEPKRDAVGNFRPRQLILLGGRELHFLLFLGTFSQKRDTIAGLAPKYQIFLGGGDLKVRVGWT